MLFWECSNKFLEEQKWNRSLLSKENLFMEFRSENGDTSINSDFE